MIEFEGNKLIVTVSSKLTDEQLSALRARRSSRDKNKGNKVVVRIAGNE